MNLLFVCTVNRMRSCTAETIYASYPDHMVRSAGTAPSATQQVTPELLRWAHMIFVMEKMHKAFILEKFPEIDVSNKLIILGIPDSYYYMEPELVELLKTRIDPFLKV